MSVRVFAYGSNLHLEDLARWMERGGFGPVGVTRALPGAMPGFRLVWDYWSSSRRGGAADVEPCEGEEVLGAVLDVDPPTFEALDEKEACPALYAREERVVRLLEGGEATAWVYRVTPKRRQAPPVWPRREYLALLVEGGRRLGLPEAYLRELAETPTVNHVGEDLERRR